MLRKQNLKEKKQKCLIGFEERQTYHILMKAWQDYYNLSKEQVPTPAQCALGFRAAMTMNRLGVREDKFESFMSDVYNRCCNNLGLTPESIASYLTNLIEFSNTIPFSQISEFIEQKA